MMSGRKKSQGSRARVVAMAVLLFATGLPAYAADAPKKVTFQDDVMPLLRNSCLNCHNPDKKKAGLDLSSYSGTMAGSDDGKVVTPGDASGSKLYRCMTRAEEPYMPQKADKLPDKELNVFRDWIAGGALETSGSKSVASAQKNNLAVVASSSLKPTGAPPMPEGLPLEPVVRGQRPGALTALAASPWAPLAAVGSEHQVLLYNTDSMQLLGVVPFKEGLPYILQFSRNGGLLMAGGGEASKSGKVVLWDVKTGKRVAEVGDEFDAVLAADISADQTMVALGGPSKVLKGYTTRDGQMAYAIKKHTDWVMAVAFSADGVLLGSGDRAGNLYVFEAKTGRDFYSLSGHKEAITAVAFRDDSNIFASASQDGTIKLWDMQNGTLVKSWVAHAGGVLSLAFAHDGRLVSCGRDNIAKIWAPDGAPVRGFDAFPDIALHAVFTHDAGKVIAGDWGGQIRVSNSADGTTAGELSSNPPTAAEVAKRAAAIEAAKKKLADASGALEGAKKEFATRQAEQQKALEAAKAAKGAADALAAQLAEAEKAMAPLANRLKDAQDKTAQLTEKVSAANAGAEAGRKAAADKEALVQAAADLAGKLKVSVEHAPDNQALVEAGTKAVATVELLKRDLASAQQTAGAKAEAVKQTSDALASAQQAMSKDKADTEAMRNNLEKLRQQTSQAAAGASAAAGAAENAAKALAGVQAKVTDLTGQLEKVRKETSAATQPAH